MASDTVLTPVGTQVWARLFAFVDAKVDGKHRDCELAEIREMTKLRNVDVLIGRFRRITKEHSPGEWLYSPFFIALRSGRGEITRRIVNDARKLLWRFKGPGFRVFFSPPDGIDVFTQAGFIREVRPDLPSVFEDRARALAASMDITAVDYEAYDPAAMVRADGTRDPASGLHRIQLTYEDIQHWAPQVMEKVQFPEVWLDPHPLD